MSVPDESNEEREHRALNLAARREREIFEEGRRHERIEGRLNSHEARLNAINGSIARAATKSEELKESIETLSEQIDKKNAVDAALRKAIQDANTKQISTREFFIGVISILAMILAGILGQVVHLI